jgi:uroporphyrinogen-III synthase
VANPVSVLITRPAPQGERLAADLAARWGDKVRIALSPLMATVVLAPDLPPGPFSGVILTSEAGAQAAGRFPGLPKLCHCVGPRTADAARAAGFEVATMAPTAAELTARLLDKDSGPLLYLHGRDVSNRIDQRLRDAGRHAEAAVVYDQQAVPLSAEAHRLLGEGGPVVVPFYSARSVRLLVAQAPDGAAIWPCAISGQVAEALPDELRRRCVVAATPDGAGLMSAIGRVISSLLG